MPSPVLNGTSWRKQEDDTWARKRMRRKGSGMIPGRSSLLMSCDKGTISGARNAAAQDDMRAMTQADVWHGIRSLQNTQWLG